MLFTDFIKESETRSNLGITYIGTIILFASVHIFILIAGTVKLICRQCKNCCHRRRLAKLQRLRVEQQKLKASEQVQLKIGPREIEEEPLEL